MKSPSPNICSVPPNLWFLIVILAVGIAVVLFGLAVALYAHHRNRKRQKYMNLY